MTTGTTSTARCRTRGKYSPIGIDFGSGRIKMLQLSKRRGRLLTHAGSHLATPRDAVKNGEIVKPELLLTRLVQALQGTRWRGRKACLAMDSRACYLRLLTLPPLKGRELKQAVLWEARKHLPFDPDQAVISFMPLDDYQAQNRPRHRYLLAAVLKETANRYTDLALKAGLKPLSLETPATAWLRLISSRPPVSNHEAQECRLHIDCGFSSTMLLLTLNGRYRYHRLLQLGIKNFCLAANPGREKNLQAALGIVYERSDLSTRGLSGEAEKLSRGIGESLAYWYDLNREASCRPLSLELSGGGFLIPGLAAFLQQKLRLKTFFSDPLTAPGLCPAGEGGGRPESSQEALFPPARGLALRGWLK